MPTYYLGSSALFNRYHSEDGTEVTNLLFAGRSRPDRFVACEIVTIEIGSAGARGLSPPDARGLLATLSALDLLQIDSVPISPALIAEARRTARMHRLRALDAIHLGAAVRASQSARQPLIFLCSDQQLLDAARSAGLVTLNPAMHDATERVRRSRA